MTQSYQSWFNSTLTKPLATWDTTLYLAVAPTVTVGRLRLYNWEQEERIKYTGVSWLTCTGLTRWLSKTADPAAGGTGLSWIAGTTVKLVAMHDQLDDTSVASTIIGAKTFSEGIITSKWVIATSYASTAARDTALWGNWVATQNYMNIKAGSAFYNYNLSTEQREIVDTGATPPAMTEAVAGIAEYTTIAEAVGWVDNNGVNALVPKPSDVLQALAYLWGICTAYNMTIATSRASSAETISLLTKAWTAPSATDPITIWFRSVTPTSGDFTYLSITSATTIVIPSTATMWATNAVAFRLWLVWFNDWGTFRLWVVNTQKSDWSILGLSDSQIRSSTIMDTASDNAGVFYTGTAVTNKAYRILWYLDYTLATAWTRGTAPSVVQLFWQWIKLPWDRFDGAYLPTSAWTAITAVVPYDDTPPLIWEWTEVFSVSFIPNGLPNKIIVDWVITWANTSGSQNTIVSIYQDGGASLFTTCQTTVSINNMCSIPLGYQWQVGTITSTTISVRLWVSAGTFNVNGQSGARLFGTINKSYIRVTEIMV